MAGRVQGLQGFALYSFRGYAVRFIKVDAEASRLLYEYVTSAASTTMPARKHGLEWLIGRRTPSTSRGVNGAGVAVVCNSSW